MAVGAYPFAAWPRVSARERELLRALLRALPGDMPELTELLGSLLGEPPSLAVRAGELWSAGEACAAIAPDALALVLEQALGAHRIPLGVELDAALATSLVDRVLGGDGRAVAVPELPLDPLAKGALAYLVARLCAAGAAFMLRDLPDDPRALSLLFGSSPVLVVPFELAFAGARAGVLRLFVPEASARALALRPARKRTLGRGLQRLRFGLCAHAATLRLPARELAELGPGDVLIPEHCRFARDGSGFHGTAVVHALGSERAVCECAARANELSVTMIHTCEERMTDDKPVNATAAVLGDAPVTLCIELARFTLSLDELSQLRPGEVLSTGRAIGQQAQLSAGGVPIARGELCEIDGEIGFRVLELAR